MFLRPGGSRRPHVVLRQRLLPPFERSLRLERWFKRAIVAVTIAVAAGLVASASLGSRAWALLTREWPASARHALGFAGGRVAIEANHDANRRASIEQTRQTYRAFYEHDASPGLRRILRAAGMAPEEVLLRWANVDWTIVLSPQVFAPNDRGRAYQMRPGVRSFWLRNHRLTRGLTSFFFLPDTAEVRGAVAEAGAAILPQSYQTTNSWGCRGPEPDPHAPFRVLVLGDSFAQGLFVADDENPGEQLRRYLASTRRQAVSVLNTGHIGYSPEQYYHTLVEYFDRFRPHCVVVNVCPNDFGNGLAVLAGRGDWSEADYWLDAISRYSWSRLIPCLLVTVPLETQITHPRHAGDYPGKAANLWDEAGFYYLDLADPFVEEHLHSMTDLIRQGQRPQFSPLYNGHINDAHFSPRGAALWGECVGRRLSILLDYGAVNDPLAKHALSARNPSQR